MRASCRGSIRSVIVTESISEVDATELSISRISMRFSAQNMASASSLWKSGTSSQLDIEFIVWWCELEEGSASPCPSPPAEREIATGRRDWYSLRSWCSEGLVHLPVIKEFLLRLEGPGEDDPHRLAVCAVNGENPGAPAGVTQVEIARL